MGTARGGRLPRRERTLFGLAGVLAALSALCLTVLPGVRFSGSLAAGLSALCALAVPFDRWAARSRNGRRVRALVRACLALGLAAFLAVEAVLVLHGERDRSDFPADAVIVLGAGVNGETPSMILQTRIDAAGAYLLAHPGVPAVLSGGRGEGEDITEAEAMRRGLTALGVEEERLMLEEQSTSTAENFKFSTELLKTRGLDPAEAHLAVVTSDFHCFRAHFIARRAGLDATGIPAEAPWPLLNLNYYIREFFALGKTILFD